MLICNCSTSRDTESSTSVYDLYFCRNCRDLKCFHCTASWITINYCPSCLFEVPLASKSQTCSRNCLNCPVCKALLSMKTNPSYHLHCNSCEWTSNGADPSKGVYESMIGISSNLSNETTKNSQFASLLKGYKSMLENSCHPVTENETEHYSVQSENLQAYIQTPIHQITSLEQRFSQFNNNQTMFTSELQPVLIPLRSKHNRICLECNECLVRSDIKATSIVFPEKQIAA